jgi:hypothetical protein
MAFSMEEFCHGQIEDDWQLLQVSSQVFLHNLGLPSLHPYCEGRGFIFPQAPPMGQPATTSMHTIESLITIWYFYVPPLITLFDLWARLWLDCSSQFCLLVL